MAYWWVSQNKTHRQELEGGYLWAPKRDKGGNTPFHWKNMERVQPGDYVVHFYGQKLQAISVVTESARSERQPDELGDLWNHEGWLVSVRPRPLSQPVPVPEHRRALLDLMPARHGPLTSAGQGNQGYLFELPPRAGRYILDLLGEQDLQEVEHLPELSVPGETEREQLGKARRGQLRFRDEVLSRWNWECAITGLGTPSLLRASHIKPWRDSNNAERLDPANGLALAINYDAVFDLGLISFDRAGLLMVSSQASREDLSRIGVSLWSRLVDCPEDSQKFLDHHREHVFKP